MDVTTPITPRPARCLTPIASDGWAVRNSFVSESDLKEASERDDIRILEVRAPLSTISPHSLADFISVHGRNIQHLNLQNSKITGDELLNLASMLPSLSSISFQYLHDITNARLLAFIAKCSKLVSIKICQCNQIRADMLLGILTLQRDFTDITIDVYGTNKRPIKPGYTPVARVKSLTLGGLAFHGAHLQLAATINSLNKLTLTMTGTAVKDFKTLDWNTLRDKGKFHTIEVNEFSDRKVKNIRNHLNEDGIRYSAKENKIVIDLRRRISSPPAILEKECATRLKRGSREE